MFGGYIAEKLHRTGAAVALRILVLEAGAFLLPSHIQNLPQRFRSRNQFSLVLVAKDLHASLLVVSISWVRAHCQKRVFAGEVCGTISRARGC